jgi:hypothetical protein
MPSNFLSVPKLSIFLASFRRKAIASFETIQSEEFNIHSFEIDCQKLSPHFYTNDIRDSEEFKSLFKSVTQISKPVVYWFEIISNTTQQEIIEKLILYKQQVNARATPAIKKITPTDSRILYVGKVKGGFWGRLITHLGYLKGTGQTQGLQLDSWATGINLKLRLCILEFDKNMEDFMSVIEYSFAKELKPIIGKHK